MVVNLKKLSLRKFKIAIILIIKKTEIISLIQLEMNLMIELKVFLGNSTRVYWLIIEGLEQYKLR